MPYFLLHFCQPFLINYSWNVLLFRPSQNYSLKITYYRSLLWKLHFISLLNLFSNFLNYVLIDFIIKLRNFVVFLPWESFLPNKYLFFYIFLFNKLLYLRKSLNKIIDHNLHLALKLLSFCCHGSSFQC